VGERYRQVISVLWRVMWLNIAVALAKIVLGYASGAVSILSDGYHSLTDSASNVVALVGVNAARKPPDDDHPYGHRKYETMASIGILIFLILVLVGVLQQAWHRWQTGRPAHVTWVSFAVMACTFAVNVFVVWYEMRRGRSLSSEILMADARHTRSDLFTSGSVVGALIGVYLGVAWLDVAAAVFIAGFIAHAGWEIARDAARILSDRIVIGEDDLRAVVLSVPEVIGCEKIRTRGSADHVFLDLHVWMDPNMRLADAHAASHVVKDRLMTRYPQIQDAIIHIEPPPRA